MAPKNTGPSLSADFLKHLGVEAKDSDGRKRRTGVQNRKEQRKESRAKPQRQPNRPAHFKQRGPPQSQQRTKPASVSANDKLKGKPAPLRVINPELEDDSIDEDDFDDDIDMSDDDDGDNHETDDDNEEDSDEDDEDADVEEDKDDDTSKTPASPAPKITGRMRERLEQDDAEIAELERKLGMKGRKNLPQSFKDDGLGDLLESLGGGAGNNEETAKKSKRKAEADEWLQAKRQKALGLERNQKQVDDDDEDDDDDDDDDMEGGSDDDFSGFEDSGDSDGSEGDADENGGRESSKKEAPKRQRENPYVAPVSASAPQKYLPPALRRAMQQGTDSESEAVTRVRRQAHHLIARLSDANMLTILGEVEKLYLENPRQYVTDAVTDKLLEQIQIEGALSSNVTVLIAGFASSVYMVKGTDFGAHFIQQSATAFKQHYDNLLKAEAEQAARDPEHLNAWAPTSKIAINLFSLMAELYNFRMIGPNLIYDYIRMLLSSLTETNTELLLRVFETSGTRLRQDDPRSLKDIASLIQPAVIKAGGEKTLSVRTRHMIDRITDIKKSDKKKQRDAESSGFGHAERIRKLLGNLPTSRKLEAAGPLRVSLADIEQSDKRGKWWLVGASWAGRDAPTADQKGADAAESAGSEGSGSKGNQISKSAKSKDDDDVLGSWGNDIADVEELDLLAREQGMNTDARRSIFVTLLSAADSKDAHARLLRLRLNKHERREIANVLIRCVGSEQTYNRYYALVARQVCSNDRRMGWVFQASLWKLFRRAGEQMFGEAPDSDDEADDNDDLNGNSGTGDDATSLRRIVNTAKLYGYLIASGTLTLDTLKCLSLIRLQTKIRMFVEVLLISVFEETQKAAKASSMDASAMIKKRFRMGKDRDDLRRGLQYFIDKVVRKSTIVDKQQQASIAKACDRAQKALRESQD